MPQTYRVCVALATPGTVGGASALYRDRWTTKGWELRNNATAGTTRWQRMEVLMTEQTERRLALRERDQITVTALEKQHWPQVREIYAYGIATGQATFEPRPPSWERFD